MSTMKVPASRPPMMVEAIEENMSSKSRGIIPNTVVSEVSITGRIRDFEASIMACVWSCLDVSCNLISSTSTMPFLSIIPTSPSVPTIATKLKLPPVSSVTGIIPTKTKRVLASSKSDVRKRRVMATRMQIMSITTSG